MFYGAERRYAKVGRDAREAYKFARLSIALTGAAANTHFKTVVANNDAWAYLISSEYDDKKLYFS
jgi:hypothetical protein